MLDLERLLKLHEETKKYEIQESVSEENENEKFENQSEENKIIEEINELLWFYCIDDINSLSAKIKESKKYIAFHGEKKNYAFKKEEKKEVARSWEIVKIAWKN